MSEFVFSELLPLGEDRTSYRLLTTEGVSVVEAAGRRFLEVEPEALRLLTDTAMRDIAHLLRPGHSERHRRWEPISEMRDGVLYLCGEPVA